MINGQTLKKELSSIFRSPIHSHSPFCLIPSSSLFFSFLRLSLICYPAFVQGRTWSAEKTTKNKNAEGRIDGFIAGYHLQGALDKFWIPLTIQEFILSYFFSPSHFLRPFSTDILIRRWWIATRKWKAVFDLSLTDHLRRRYLRILAARVMELGSAVLKLSCCKTRAGKRQKDNV